MNTSPVQAIDPASRAADHPALAIKVAKLETTVDHVTTDMNELKTELREFRKEVRADIMAIRTHDFRLIFGALIAVTLGLATLMARTFHWI
jgi:hypothetical protein